MKIPLTILNITRAQLEATGIGVMITGGEESSSDSLPHDETTLDNFEFSDSNSSMENEDSDLFTSPWPRVGSF